MAANNLMVLAKKPSSPLGSRIKSKCVHAKVVTGSFETRFYEISSQFSEDLTHF